MFRFGRWAVLPLDLSMPHRQAHYFFNCQRCLGNRPSTVNFAEETGGWNVWGGLERCVNTNVQRTVIFKRFQKKKINQLVVGTIVQIFLLFVII